MTIAIPSSSSSSSVVRDIDSVHASSVLPRSWRTLDSFSRRMGFHRRSSVHSSDPQRRILPSVSSSSSSSSPSPFSVHGSLKAGTNQGRRRGGSGVARQGCHPSNLQNVSRFGIEDFRRSQERRRMASNYQPEVVEQDVSRSSSLPDGHGSGRGGSSSSRRLDSVDRLEGCLFSCPRQSPLPPLPSLRVERPSLRIFGPSIRPLPRPSHLHVGDEAAAGVSSCSGDSLDLLPRRHPNNRVDEGGVSRPFDDSPSSSLVGRFCRQSQEVVIDSGPAVPLSRLQLGHSPRPDYAGRRQAPQSDFSCVIDGIEQLSSLPRSSDSPRPSHGGDPGGSPYPPSRAFSPARSKSNLSIGEGLSSPRPAFDGVSSRSALDRLFGISPVRSPDVVSSARGLRGGGVDGCVGYRLGHLLPGSATSRPLVLDCRCPSPYQCEGTHDASHLPAGLPSPSRLSSLPSLADGQLHRDGLHTERRWHDISPSSSSCSGDPPPRPSASNSDSSGFCLVGGESSRRRGVSLPCSTGLVSSRRSIPSDCASLGSPHHRPFCVDGVGSSAPILCLGGGSGSGSPGRSGADVGFPARLRVSSSADSPPNHPEDSIFFRHLSSRDAVLASSKVVSGHFDSPRGRRSASSGSSASHRPDDGPASAVSPPSSRLEDFRRLRASSVSDASFSLICDSWRPSTAARYDAVWRSFRDFLRSRRISLLSVDLTVVLDYFAFLDEKGLAYRTITLHRSVLSATLLPVDGHDVGHHPLISRLLRGVFQRRPPTRRFFPSWDVAAVFAVFASSPLPLDFATFQRKVAFLLAMASSRRPSEVASLRCSSAFMIINADCVRFLPSRLSKTDRPDHLGPPIIVRRLPAFSGNDVSLCPVAALEDFLGFRRSLAISHDFLFSSSSSPYAPLSTAAFSDLLRWSFQRAGIAAPPGSTRSVSVSDAFARGVGVQDCLEAGDWSGASTFFRHYLRPSASV